MKKFKLILIILIVLAALIAVAYIVTPVDSERMLERPWFK